MPKPREIVEATTELIKQGGKVADSVHTSKEEYLEQANERYEIEMKSDSWFTKNIRPMILSVLMLLWLVIVIFGLDVDDEIVTSLKEMTKVAFIFYFGSRGGEKIMEISARTDNKIRRKEARWSRKDAKNKAKG